MMKKKYSEILNYLDELLPNPHCELHYFNDYSLLIAVMLSAQTTDARVNIVTKELFTKYPNLEALKEANFNDLKDIVHSLGNYTKKAFNIKEIARILVDNYDGIVPKEREILETLPGIGRKTVNVYYAEYLKIPAIAVDTHVERVCKRLKLVPVKASVLEIEKTLMKNILEEEWGRRHLQLVLFGRYYCQAKNPSCQECQLKDICYFYKKKGKKN